MPKLSHRLAHACLCAAVAVPMSSTLAAAGGNGSLFSSDSGMFGAMRAAASSPQPTPQPTPLLYADAEPVRIEIEADVPVEQLHLASARRTAFLEILNRRAIALIGIASARCNRRISAQSSTLITLHRVTEGVRFHPSIRGQFSPVVDTGVAEPGEAQEGFARLEAALPSRLDNHKWIEDRRTSWERVAWSSGWTRTNGQQRSRS